MKTTLLFIVLASINNVSEAINLDAIAMNKSQVEVKTLSEDGPTNGMMADDEKDTLI